MPYEINAFQAPQQQTAFVPSATTSQMMAPNTGTIFDPVSQYGLGLQRKQAEQAVAEQAAQQQQAAAQLEQTRYDAEIVRRQQAAEALAENQLIRQQQGVADSYEAAQEKARVDKEAAKLLADQKVKAKREERAFEKEQKKIEALATVKGVTSEDIKQSSATIMSMPQAEGFMTVSEDGKSVLSPQGRAMATEHARLTKQLVATYGISRANAMASYMVLQDPRFTAGAKGAHWYSSDTPASWNPTPTPTERPPLSSFNK